MHNFTKENFMEFYDEFREGKHQNELSCDQLLLIKHVRDSVIGNLDLSINIHQMIADVLIDRFYKVPVSFTPGALGVLPVSYGKPSESLRNKLQAFMTTLQRKKMFLPDAVLPLGNYKEADFAIETIYRAIDAVHKIRKTPGTPATPPPSN